jgi:hypothetical protein
MAEREVVTLLDGIRAHKLIVLTCGLLLGLLAGAYAWLSTPPAVASGSLGLISPAAGNPLLPIPTGDATMARYVSQRALFAKSDAVLAQAAPAVPGISIDDLRQAASVNPSKTGNALQFAVNGSSPRKASILTKALMDAYRAQTEADVQSRTEATAAALEASGDAATADRIVADGKAFGDGVEFEVRPSAAQAATRGVLSKEAVLGLLVGLGAGAFIAWGLEDARRQRRSARPAEGPGQPLDQRDREIDASDHHAAGAPDSREFLPARDGGRLLSGR